MKKKLLLLPIVLMSSFMGACSYRTEFVRLEEILTLDSNINSQYYIDGSFNIDMLDEVYKFFQTNLVGAELVKRGTYDDGYKVKSVSYGFDFEQRYKKMDYFYITVYTTGYIDVMSTGSGWPMSPERQCAVYKIDKEKAQKTYKDVSDYTRELEERIEQERQEELEKLTLENFFASFSNMEYRRIIHDREGYDSNRHRPYHVEHVFMNNDDLYEDILGLGYEEVIDDTNYDDSICVILKTDNDTQLTIERYGAFLVGYYDSKFYDSPLSVNRNFKLNEERVDNLLRKMDDLIAAQDKTIEQ